MHRGLPSRDVPLPARAFAAWPDELILPSSRPAALLGFNCPSQVCSRDRWPIISDWPGPHACSSTFAPRLIFVGLISPLAMGNMRANQRATRPALKWIGFWALAPVCGPFPKADGKRDARRRALWIVPALGFACCRAAGTRVVHSDGLDPIRIIKP
jgi:hypothetical protein